MKNDYESKEDISKEIEEENNGTGREANRVRRAYYAVGIVLAILNVIQLLVNLNKSHKIREYDTKLHTLQAALQAIDFMARPISWYTKGIKESNFKDNKEIEKIKQDAAASYELAKSILITAGTALWYHFIIDTYNYWAYRVGTEVSKYSEWENLPKPFREKAKIASYLEAARMLELQGRIREALRDYSTALFLIQTDDVDDSSQEKEILKIKEEIGKLEDKMK